MYIDMLPLKKIYIDSRDRTVDSKSASNFKIELPNTVQMPDNTVFFVTDVCVPHVWKTIEEGFNDRLYLRYNTPFPPAPGLRGETRLSGIPHRSLVRAERSVRYRRLST
jgi:hypothetical protein